jgi:hypothetical protein
LISSYQSAAIVLTIQLLPKAESASLTCAICGVNRPAVCQ